jgi:hypothetical protein
LANAKSRVATLEKKIRDSKEEETHEKEEAVAVASLEAENEKALSTSEKETFSGFLKEEFFTKKDLGRLEEFYAHTWDRLSEHGKDEMSKRVWEGVRRNEYKFSDLPKDVQEKETDRVYAVLQKPGIESSRVSQIPQADREQFIAAYDSGHKDQAEVILTRKSFANNMFVSSALITRASVDVTKDKDSASKDIAAGAKAGAKKAPDQQAVPSESMAQPDFSSVNFNGAKSADKSNSVSPTNIASVAGNNSLQR